MVLASRQLPYRH